MERQSVRAIVLALVIVAALTGTLAAQTARPSQVVFARPTDILTADPTVDAYGAQREVFVNVCDPLVAVAEGGKLEPRLAESWKAEDPKTYVFKLRRGVRFHDGSPVTAEDVKFTLERILDPKTKSNMAADFVPVVASVDAPDPLTVRISLKVPLVPFINQMPSVYVISKRAFESAGEREFGRKPICAGPYKLSEWLPNERIVLDAFDGYFRGAPKIRRLIFRPIPDPSARVAALRAGEADLVEGVPPDQIALVERANNLQIIATQSGAIQFLLMNAFEDPFKNKRVRWAMNYAVDWDTVIKGVFGGYARKAPSPILPFVFGYKPVVRYFYDPERAKRLLAEAGYPDGFTVVMETPSGRWSRDREMAQAIAGYLQQVGVKVEMRTFEWGEFLRRYRSKEPRLLVWNYRNIFFDFDDVGLHFEPDRRGWYWNHPQLTQMFAEARNTIDQNRRKAVYSRAVDLIMEEAPWLFGVELETVYGRNRRLNWKPISGTWYVDFYGTSTQ